MMQMEQRFSTSAQQDILKKGLFQTTVDYHCKGIAGGSDGVRRDDFLASPPHCVSFGWIRQQVV